MTFDPYDQLKFVLTRVRPPADPFFPLKGCQIKAGVLQLASVTANRELLVQATEDG